MHRFSGWPGAWCLDCGSPDLREESLADNCLDCVWDMGPDDHSCEKHTNKPCEEPNSNRHNPYYTHQQ